MKQIKIKLLSINQAWQGRRFKTKAYHDFEKELFYLLPKQKIPEGKLELYLKFGFSSKLSDIDNPVKIVQDVMQKKYQFNDRDIYKLVIEKEIVKKGKEYLEFRFATLVEISSP